MRVHFTSHALLLAEEQIESAHAVSVCLKFPRYQIIWFGGEMLDRIFKSVKFYVCGEAATIHKVIPCII